MYYQRSTLGIGGGLTPAVKNIIFANAIIFFIKFLNINLYSYLTSNLALHAYDVIYQFKIWQLVTYMFLHGDFWHIFFNMFIFWMFGAELEREWGSKEFLKYYFICGIGAGLVNILLTSKDPGYVGTVGASGAIYGTMVAYALYYPDRMVFIYFLIPVKVKYFVGFMAVLSFLSTMNAQSDGIAHAAHLGGIVVGYVYLKFGRIGNRLKKFLKSPKGKTKFTYRQGGDDAKLEYYRQKINELLDKINKVGYLNLTAEEKELLEEGSKYLREHDSKDYQ
jgi:membrane associated rhomboid family serine protease